jgi:hypothetical protein
LLTGTGRQFVVSEVCTLQAEVEMVTLMDDNMKSVGEQPDVISSSSPFLIELSRCADVIIDFPFFDCSLRDDLAFVHILKRYDQKARV